MCKNRKNPEISTKKKKRTKVVKDPETGLFILSGPKFTKEDVKRDFPEDSDRDAIIIRRSVGL